MRAFEIIVVTLALALAACGTSNKANSDARPTADAAPIPDAGVGPDAACFTNPQSHYEIINACTNAQSVDKTATLPLTLSDGGLPPLP